VPLGLTPEAHSLVALFTAQPSETFAPGQAVFWEGDASNHVFHVLEGCLRLYRVLPDGRRPVMGFLFAGEVFGVSFPGLYLYTAEAVTPVRLRRLSRKRLDEIEAISSDVLHQQIMSKIYDEMNATQHLIIMLGQLSAEERVANFLVWAAHQTGMDRRKPVSIDLPMNRLDIADYLGLTIETVCRVLSKFKRDGLVSLEGRHRIVLQGMSTLARMAGEMDGNGIADIPVVSRQRLPLPN
jgi:CRP/FNR family transcriptional regulator